ncbi:MAG: hypothetical protein FWC73_07400 [Defluviitaleaceae bacterium]|nr:hypothetical protein [Defluviitaleaceae bacterium]
MGFYYDRYTDERAADNNIFRSITPESKAVPTFEEIKHLLPKPYWQGNDDTINCYWKAWELAFKNIGTPTAENGFVSNYLKTCFNECLFMWDSVFALMFGKYGRKAFNFQKTLDNLYCKQHVDGFICREIAENDGTDRFHRHDPSSTGPNVMPWSEWEYYLLVSDKERLNQVYPVLAAYHNWLKAWRTWPDGSYWSSGWGTGMDNQPRPKPGDHPEFYHGHMTWVDACLQMIFSAKTLVKMAKALNREEEAASFEEEARALTLYVNEQLWNKDSYFDLYSDGTLSNVRTIGVYWALLADIVPADRLDAFVASLEDPKRYNRTHRVPSMPADSPSYCPEGNYWRGGVWVFTNYMLLRGLTNTGYDTLAYEIALNHVSNVVKVFNETGTIWENYSPEAVKQGNPALPDFVGAGGISPIAVLFEYIFGIRASAHENMLVWDVRRLEAHGVDNYPFGISGVLNLACKTRQSESEEPEIAITSNIPLDVMVKWNNGTQSKIIKLRPNSD